MVDAVSLGSRALTANPCRQFGVLNRHGIGENTYGIQQRQLSTNGIRDGSGQRSEKKHSRIGNLLRAMRSPSNVQLTKDEAASTFSTSFDPSMSTTLDLSSRQPFFVLQPSALL